MNRFLMCAVFCLAVLASASAQPITTSSGGRSDEIYTKLRKIDLVNQLLPLLLTKEQINRELLPAIEKARSRQKLVLTEEDAELQKLDAEVSETLKNAYEKNEYPKKEFLTRVAAKTKEMTLKRNLALLQMSEEVANVVDRTFTEAQKKIMEGSFDAAFIDSSKKPEEITPDAKRGFFIRTVLLDPFTREVLIEMAKFAK